MINALSRTQPSRAFAQDNRAVDFTDMATAGIFEANKKRIIKDITGKDSSLALSFRKTKKQDATAELPREVEAQFYMRMLNGKNYFIWKLETRFTDATFTASHIYRIGDKGKLKSDAKLGVSDMTDLLQTIANPGYAIKFDTVTETVID